MDEFVYFIAPAGLKKIFRPPDIHFIGITIGAIRYFGHMTHGGQMENEIHALSYSSQSFRTGNIPFPEVDTAIIFCMRPLSS